MGDGMIRTSKEGDLPANWQSSEVGTWGVNSAAGPNSARVHTADPGHRRRGVAASQATVAKHTNGV